ncbi:hypothetical protein TrLO_g9395 [Triparma laevis f. longispina]|nr:hypothetical protein TrLO_g9395 [Triparma laevis f. longispina]
MKLLSECGVVLPSPQSDDSDTPSNAPLPYCITVSPNTLRSSVASLLKELQQLPAVDLQTIVLDDMEAVLSDETTLHSMLLPMNLEASTSSNSNSSSLVKVLLRQPFLQSRLLQLLLQALPSIDTSTSLNPIPKLILTSVRWLDTIYDPTTLTATTLEVISVCEKAMQLDLISILPDIIPDSSADKAVEKLMELKEDDPSLLLPILDAVSSLRLSPVSLHALTFTTLDSISAAEPSSLPAITRFLMHHTSTSFSADVVKNLRGQLKILPTASAEQSSASTLIFEALAQGFQYRPDLTTELLNQITATVDSSEHSVADVFLLLCANLAPHNKIKITNTIRKKILHRIIGQELVNDAIENLGDQITILVPSFLGLADSLLRAPELPCRELGGAIYEALFFELKDLMARQEIVAQLTTHVGSGSSSEVDCAMSVLQQLTVKDSAKLKPFSAFITSMLDSLSNMTLPQIRRLFVTLFTLADDTDGDDVRIVIRKHLSHANVRMKRIGIIGVTAFAVSKSLNLRKDNRQMATIVSLETGVAFPAERLQFADSTNANGAAESNNNAPTSGDDVIKVFSEIKTMLELAHDTCDPSKNRAMYLSPDAPSPLGFLFDELALAIKGNQVAPVVKTWVLERYQDLLENLFMGDFEEHDEDGAEGAANNNANANNPTPGDNLLPDVTNPSISPNVLKPTDSADLSLLSTEETAAHRQEAFGEMRFNEDGVEADIYLRLLPFAVTKDAVKMSQLSILVPLLRLLSACHDPRYGGSGLADIDAVIGAPLLLMESEQAGINYQDLPEHTKRAGLMSTYYAVNWVRELLNCFVHDVAFPNFSLTQGGGDEQIAENLDIKSKIVKRLVTLVELEDDLRFQSRDCDSFCPPNCSSLLNRRSKPSQSDASSFNDSQQDLILPPAPDYKEMTKEDAKEARVTHNNIVKGLKAKHRQLKAQDNQKQKKLEQETDKKRDLLESRTMASLRRLSPDMVLALGFPTMAAIVGSNPSQVAASQALTSSSEFRVGGKAASLLLRMLNESLEAVVVTKPTLSWLSRDDGSSANKDLVDDDDSENPYTGGRSGVALTKLDRYITRLLEGGVFASVHEHLVVMVEIIGNDGAENENGEQQMGEEDKAGVVGCLDYTLSLIRLLMGSEKLTVCKEGRALLFSILKQLANGEKGSPTATQRSVAPSQPQQATAVVFVTALKALFDLVEEISQYPQNNELSFNMKVISTLESIIGCSQRLVDALIEPHQQLETAAGEVRKIAMQCRKKLSQLSLKFLSYDWCPVEMRSTRNKFMYSKANVGVMVRAYVENSGTDKILIDAKIPLDLLKTDVSKIGRIGALTNLSSIIEKLAETENQKGPVVEYPTLTGQSVVGYFSVIVGGLSVELERLFQYTFVAKESCKDMVMRAITALTMEFKKMCDLVKKHECFRKKTILLAHVKGGVRFVETYVKIVLPYFGQHFDALEDELLRSIKEIQLLTRSLQNITSWGKRENDLALIKETPKVKKTLELFIYSVKGLMKDNNVVSAIFNANLKARDLDGSELKGSSESEEESDDDDDDDGDDDSDDEEGEGEGGDDSDDDDDDDNEV